MANWVKIKYAEYDGSSESGLFEVQVHYDGDSDTPESMKVRFKVNRLKYQNTSYSSNGYYLLVNPGKDSEKLYTLKAPGDNWDDSVTTEITLSKKFSAASFTVPGFWICNTGSTTPNKSARTIEYGSYSGSFYNCFKDGGPREGYVTRVSSDTQGGIKASDGAASAIKITDTKNNTFIISGSITAGAHNAFKSAKIYYTTDGSTPGTSSNYKTPSSAGEYSFTIKTPSDKSSSKVRAVINCNFTYNTVITSSEQTVYYYTDGTVASPPKITDNGNNKFTILCTAGKAGWNNAITGATLYYAIDNNGWQSKAMTTTGENKFIIDIPGDKASRNVFAYIKCTYNRNETTSAQVAVPVKYYTAIGKPSISIKDNLNNTFTITGAPGPNGTNNIASTTYAWGYSTSYGNSGTGEKDLTIATPSSATRTVYAKATSTPSWSVDSTKTATASLAIKQYVAPNDPGIPVLSYTKSRLTIKEPWTFSWSAAAQANTISPVRGYYIMLLRCPAGSSTFNFVREITGSTADDYINISPGSNSNTDTNYYIRRENTSCTTILENPVSFGFTPGDKVKLRIRTFTRNGANEVIQGSIIDSAEYLVQNAGIVRARVNGAWKEGQVYVKVNGAWKEAETVSTKVNGAWKESQ